MIHPSLKLLLLSLLAVGLQSTSLVYAEPVAGGPAESGLVVLQNGNVVRGNIQRLDDHYRVELPGGELRIRAEQVEMFCTDLDAAYRQRRANRTATSADAHLELARWCMRYDLHEHAATELADARKIDSDHRRLPLLERQLQQLVKLSARAKQSPVIQPPTAEERVAQEKSDQQVLDKAPKWARVLFVRQVQPLLVHSCATAGCHQPGSSTEKFQLDRLAIDAAGHPSVTQRNLAATLAQLNWDAPEKSELLQQALTAHGETEVGKREPLSPHKIKLLKMWVEQLAAVNQARAATELVAAKPTSPDPNSLETPPLKQSPEKVQLTGYVKRDPFDADFFNSHFGSPAETATPLVPEQPENSPNPPLEAAPAEQE